MRTAWSAFFAFEEIAKSATYEESRNGRKRRKNIPNGADLTAHQMLLAKHRSEPILCARYKEK